MLPGGVRLIAVVLLILAFSGGFSRASAKDPKPLPASHTEPLIELPQVFDYSFKTALFEYFSGRYPSFEKLLQPQSAYRTDDPYSHLRETGDDNLALIAELSSEYKVYLGNLYQLFLIESNIKDELGEQFPAVASVMSLLKGAARQPLSAQAGTGSEDAAASAWFLDKLYTHSYYSDLMRISKKKLLRSDTSGATAYFRGITLLAMNNSADAPYELRGVERVSPLYPYARVAFGQALFDSGDLSGAEREFKALLIGTAMDAELREKVRLLLGQVYFEEDLFGEALMEFMNIPRTSPYYRESVICTAWALIKNNTFETAVGMLKELGNEPPYDSLEWEAQVMLGYGYMQLELHGKALALFDSLLSDITMARTNLDKMAKDSSVSSRYLDYLLQSELPASLKAMVSANTRAFSRDEAMYFSIFSNDDSSKILLQEYAVMLRLREGILGRRADIAQRRLYFKNMISGMQGLFSFVDLETNLIKRILTNIDSRVDPGKDPRDNINERNRDFFKDVENGLYAHWRKIKDREINKNEKEVVRLLLYDVGESLDCVKTSLICTIVDMADDKEELSSARLHELSDIMNILEAIALDIQSVRDGDLIAYEKSIEVLRNAVTTKTKAAKAGILHLDKMDVRLRSFIDESDIIVRRRMLAVVNTQIKHRVKGFNDDLTELRAHIVTGLISSQKVIEEMRANER